MGKAGAKKIRAVEDRYAFVACEDIKKGDLLEVKPYCNFDDFGCYGNEGWNGSRWGFHFKEHRDGSGCEAVVYEDGVERDLGKFETTVMAMEAAIEKVADSTSDQDNFTLDQLNYWLAVEKEKAEKQ